MAVMMIIVMKINIINIKKEIEIQENIINTENKERRWQGIDNQC